MPRLLILFLILLSSHARATPAEAERVKRIYDLSVREWTLAMKLAATPEERQAQIAKRPDPAENAKQLWASISGALKEDWTIPYGALFLNLTRGLITTDESGATAPAFAKQRQLVIETIDEANSNHPEITPFVIALIEGGDLQTISLLEKIQATHPDQGVQGIAALGAALLLKNLGDEPELMQKRLTYLRKAIIQSADIKVAKRTVADIAADELFVIRHLVKGRDAPELSGTDVAGRPVKISEFKGRIVILLFWDAQMAQTDKVIELTNHLVTHFRDKPVTILGITPEPLERLRALQADDSITWNNIHDPADKLALQYRINSRPSVFVLDAEGKIQYTGLPGSFVELTVDALLAGP